MKLSLQFPRACEARVRTSERTGDVLIEPVFGSEKGKRTVLYVVVAGEGGAEKLYTIDVHGGTGKLTCNEVREVRSHFDQLPREEIEETDPDALPLSNLEEEEEDEDEHADPENDD